MTKCLVSKSGDSLKILDGPLAVPEGATFCAILLNEAELAAWNDMPEESRFWMLAQAGSASFKEWMDEDEWDTVIESSKVAEKPDA